MPPPLVSLLPDVLFKSMVSMPMALLMPLVPVVSLVQLGSAGFTISVTWWKCLGYRSCWKTV